MITADKHGAPDSKHLYSVYRVYRRDHYKRMALGTLKCMYVWFIYVYSQC